MRLPPGMAESIASVRRNLAAIDELITRSTHSISESREALRRANALLERDTQATSRRDNSAPAESVSSAVKA
jgi:hypothetical protein